MKAFLAHIFTQQTPPPGSNEGLPYWIFWLLLCFILLLVIFIFLRDKDLRRRLSLFLFGAKKKLIKIRLQARLKREYRRKSEIFKNMGKKIWQEGMKIPRSQKIGQELTKLQQYIDELDQESKECQDKIHELEAEQQKFLQKHEELVREHLSARNPYQEKLAEIRNDERLLDIEIIRKQKEMEGLVRAIGNGSLHKAGNPVSSEKNGRGSRPEAAEKLEEMTRKREEADRQIKDLVEKRLGLETEQKVHQEKIDELDEKIEKIEEGGKKRIKEFNKEIKEWRKNKEKLLERIKNNEERKDPLFLRFGQKAEESRVDQEKLSLFYSQIDRSNERIRDLERQIKNL
jgi:chromosome segregation ATPase